MVYVYVCFTYIITSLVGSVRLLISRLGNSQQAYHGSASLTRRHRSINKNNKEQLVGEMEGRERKKKRDGGPGRIKHDQDKVQLKDS